MENILINITTEPIKYKHISWNVEIRGREIILYQIVENIYKHPDAPEHATISKIEEEKVLSYNIIDKKAASLFLLKNALDNISNFIVTKEDK
uniref:Uncharacterized protein n=1 Tax=viral metagenome TaxID=1070528 RepID=A0A6M3LHN8_9ZZZZ